MAGDGITYKYKWWCADCDAQRPSPKTAKKCVCGKNLHIACDTCKEYVTSKKSHGVCTDVNNSVVIIAGRARYNIPKDYILPDPFKFFCKICYEKYEKCPTRKKKCIAVGYPHPTLWQKCYKCFHPMPDGPVLIKHEPCMTFSELGFLHVPA